MVESTVLSGHFWLRDYGGGWYGESLYQVWYCRCMCRQLGGKILLFMATDEEVLEYTLIRMGDVLRDRYDVTVTGSQPKTSKIENNNKKEKIARTRV